MDQTRWPQGSFQVLPSWIYTHNFLCHNSQSLVYFKESKNQALNKEKTVLETRGILSNMDFALILLWIPVTSRNSRGRTVEVKCLPDNRSDDGPAALRYSTRKARRAWNARQHLCQPSPCL